MREPTERQRKPENAMSQSEQWQTAEPGVRRRILEAQGRLMLMEVEFEANAAGYEHSHVHEQISYCISGPLRVSPRWTNPSAVGRPLHLRAERRSTWCEGARGGHADRRVHTGPRGFARAALS